MPAANRTLLTPDTVERLLPRPTEYTIWDTVTPKLGVRVRPSGASTYVTIRKTPDGSRRISLGSTAVITLDEARQQAKFDEAHAFSATTPPPTILPPRFLDFVTSDWWPTSGFDNLPRRRKRLQLAILTDRIFPTFGSEPLDAITPLVLDSWFGALRDDSPRDVQAALALLKDILSLARARGHITSDPTRLLHARASLPAPDHRQLRSIADRIGDTLESLMHLDPAPPAFDTTGNRTPPSVAPAARAMETSDGQRSNRTVGSTGRG